MDSKILFNPYTFNNGVTVNSRLVVAPLTLFSSNEDGSVSDGEAKFLSTRAEHIGLYIQGATLVTKNGQVFPCQPRAIYDSDLGALAERAAIIKKQGALSIVQLHHGGHPQLPACAQRGVPHEPRGHRGHCGTDRRDGSVLGQQLDGLKVRVRRVEPVH